MTSCLIFGMVILMKKIAEKLKLIFVPDKENQFQPLALGEKTLLFYCVGFVVLKIVVLFMIFYLPATDFFSAINTAALVNLINQAREVNNLEPLNFNDKLSQAAQLKAQDMIVQDYFEHYSPLGVSPWHWFKEAGYEFVWAGENLAMNFFDTKAVFEAWMASPSHRDNILNPNYDDLGVAVLSGELSGAETTVSVLTFGSPKVVKIQSSQPPVQAATANKETGGERLTEGEKTETAPAEGADITELAKEESAKPQEEGIELEQAPGGFFERAIILGVATSRWIELAKNTYLYFGLFLIIALAINILVKIRIQQASTIVLSIILIGISIGLAFV